MDLRDQLLRLFSPTQVGQEVWPGARLLSLSIETGIRVTLEINEALIHVEIKPASEGGPFAARSKLFLFSYRSGGESSNISPALGMKCCKTLATLAQRHEEEIVTEMRAAALESDTGADQQKVRELNVDSLLELRQEGTERYYSLSPYVGCVIGCRFCYAQDRLAMVRRLINLKPLPWGSWVDVRINAAEILRAELSQLEPRPIKFCPIVSDPYQAIEKRYRLTRKSLNVFRDFPQWPLLLLTRSTLIEEDLDLMTSLPNLYAGVSLPTLDDNVRKHFEPRGASIPERLSTLEKLRKAKIKTIAVIQPMLPGPVDALAETLQGLVGSVSLDILRGEYGAVQDFAHEAFNHCRELSWQTERLKELQASLKKHEIPVWSGEFPPDLQCTPT